MEHTAFLPPWRDRDPDGALGPEYGPRNVLTYLRQIERWKDWSWRVPSRDARRDADQMIAFMRGEDGELRADVPSSEREVYLLVYEKGHSVRWVARERKVTRDTIRSYMRRLKARLPVAPVNGGR